MSRNNKQDIKIEHLLERNARKHREYSAANYLERLREEEEEEKKVRGLSRQEMILERRGEFVTVKPGTQIFVPFGEDKNKAVQQFNNKLLERQNKW